MRNKDQWFRRLAVIRGPLSGAEGEDDDADPQVGDNDELNPEPSKTYDQAYVDSLRAEAAKRRVEAKEAADRAEKSEAELAKIRKAEMSELEAATATVEELRAQREEAVTQAEALRTQLIQERVLNSVTTAAMEMGFNDPTDALSMIDQTELVDDDGNVQSRTVKARLKALSDSKPYLLKPSGAGSGDGRGGRTPPKEDDTTWEGRVAAHKQKMIESGRVPA